jgi:hypothetical protein
LRIYNLDRLQIYSLGDGRVLVCILGYRGIAVRILGYRGIIVRVLGYGGIIVYSIVRNLRVGYILASEVNFKAAYVYRVDLVK